MPIYKSAKDMYEKWATKFHPTTTENKVENKTEVKIKIAEEENPEDIELKKKLQNMLKSLVQP